MEVIYEDNHIIVVNKESGEIVQGDKTGDRPLSDLVRDYIKEKYQKPGAVFLGVVHRLDRPVAGLVVFARTSKALARLNKMFAEGEVHKTYWAIVSKMEEGKCKMVADGEWHTLENWLTRNEKQNKSYAYDREAHARVVSIRVPTGSFTVADRRPWSLVGIYSVGTIFSSGSERLAPKTAKATTTTIPRCDTHQRRRLS